MTVNGTGYRVIKPLGKGGYFYLVSDGGTEYVLKKIHHEPCDYYTFGDKLASELRDYETLIRLGIPVPRLIDVDKEQERLPLPRYPQTRTRYGSICSFRPGKRSLLSPAGSDDRQLPLSP